MFSTRLTVETKWLHTYFNNTITVFYSFLIVYSQYRTWVLVIALEFNKEAIYLNCKIKKLYINAEFLSQILSEKNEH